MQEPIEDVADEQDEPNTCDLCRRTVATGARVITLMDWPAPELEALDVHFIAHVECLAQGYPELRPVLAQLAR